MWQALRLRHSSWISFTPASGATPRTHLWNVIASSAGPSSDSPKAHVPCDKRSGGHPGQTLSQSRLLRVEDMKASQGTTTRYQIPAYHGHGVGAFFLQLVEDQPRSPSENLSRLTLHDFQADSLFHRVAHSVHRHFVRKPFAELSEDNSSPPSTVRSLTSNASSANAACPSSIVHNHEPSVSGFMPRDFFTKRAALAHRFHTLVCSSTVANSREPLLRCARHSHVPTCSKAKPEYQSSRCLQHNPATSSCDELSLHTVLAQATADVTR